MRRQRIVITGLGGICGLGVNTASIWEAMRTGRSAIGEITTTPLYELKIRTGAEVRQLPEVGFDRRRLVTMDRYSLFAAIAAGEALTQAKVSVTSENTARIGAVVGTGIFGAETVEDNYRGLFLGGGREPMYFPCRARCRAPQRARSAWSTACAARSSA